MIKQSNYLSEKFLLNSYKADLKNIMNKSGVLKTFDISRPKHDVVQKTYYDTENKFFRENGINICRTTYKSLDIDELVVRYESKVERIKFIKDIPDTFLKQIDKKDLLTDHYSYIAKAAWELVPKGLNADVFQVVKKLIPILSVTKKRERYRAVNNNGLKVIFSFEVNSYVSLTKKRQKETLNMLELKLETSTLATENLFEIFIKRLHLQQPLLVKQKRSDLLIASDYIEI